MNAVKMANAPTSRPSCTAVGRPTRKSAAKCARVGAAPRQRRVRSGRSHKNAASVDCAIAVAAATPATPQPNANTNVVDNATLTTLAAIDASIGERASPSP